uniref:ATP synthase complex subunit 8 n=1 Tax=Omus cazieri TaxID=1343352 RepID=A0A343EYR5_9CARA|nr:ATP synthase F0 subunit 8 [Omus cazieri]
MPQMAPMNWMILYIMFIFIFLFINFMNYYLFLIKNPDNKSKNLITKMLNWKW